MIATEGHGQPLAGPSPHARRPRAVLGLPAPGSLVGDLATKGVLGEVADDSCLALGQEMPKTAVILLTGLVRDDMENRGCGAGGVTRGGSIR